MKKEMLINVLQPEECRIAIVEDGILEELYVERTSHESYTGNIYKGKVVNLEPAIQAAFVDFSVGRNGFLHVSDVEPQYYRRHLTEDVELTGRDKNREPWRDREEPWQPRAGRGSSPAHEERPRERDRDRDRDRGHERERPDRSEKGRRDRSEPRRFGEGLTDEDEDWTPPPPPPPRAAEPPPPPAPEPEREEPRRPIAEPPPFGWGIEMTSSEREREFGAIEPDEPRARLPRSAEPFESNLPPSRTHRGRGSAPSPSEPSAFWPAPEPPPTSGSGRRGRGRSFAAAPEPTSRFAPEPEPPQPPPPELEEPPAEEPPAESPPPPRRRGGRAAIRSRGGEPQVERLRSHPPEEEAERPRRRPRDRESERTSKAAEPESSRAHDRAGEPGYVPRRERSRTGEPPYEPPGEALAPGWPEPPPAAEEDEDRLLGEAEEGEGTELADESGKLKGGRRRRRRRGRRRERPEREPGTETARDEDAEIGRSSEYEPPWSRESSAPTLQEPHLEDDFDFGEETIISEEEDEETVVVERVVSEEDRIDPELEEEIRKEVEEIAELERELGLRGPVEARPRRADERVAEPGRPGGRPARGRGIAKPPIQEIFRRGDEVLVQVIKESIGTKGPTLSTYISIPGRYLVLMPGLNRVGVSRKIADEGQRRKLREIMNELNPPKGLGFIVRTAGLDRSKRELARDLAYLLRLWKVILRRIKKTRAPAPIYQESDMITRTIRDIFTAEIDTIWIDEKAAFERAQEFLRVVMPRFVNRLKLYDEKVPLFHKYGIEEEIVKIQRRHVPLPEGGSIVIDQTEAMVAIDVNSGNFRVENDAERTAYEMNLRAAKEIARQLRLRDLGGVIVNDFIDMREERNRRGVERALREAIKRDRARTKVLRMSQFGLIEMTRQRIRPSLRRSVYEDCPHCSGAGVTKTVESMAIDVMRLLALTAHRDDIRRINISVCPAVSSYLNNRKRREIARIELEGNMVIHIRHEDDVPAEHMQFDCFDSQNNEVRLLPVPAPAPRGRGR